MVKLNKISHISCLHVVVGAFDGLHKAHCQIINHAVQKAKLKKEHSLIFTFEPLPKEFFLNNEFHGRLLPKDIKKEMLEQFQSDYLVITNFEDIYHMSEREFVDQLLLYADKIVFYAGEDFRLGCTSGEPYTGSCIEIIKEPELIVDGHHCRATDIRALISCGQIEEANKLLGYEYVYYSYTCPGDQIGRKIGFPTINIEVQNQLVPRTGVYFGEIFINNSAYPVMIYIGNRPTVDGVDLRIESHVISEFPAEEIPKGTKTCVRFIKKIAQEKSFESIENLKEMLYNYKTISSGLATERYKNHTPIPPFIMGAR